MNCSNPPERCYFFSILLKVFKRKAHERGYASNTTVVSEFLRSLRELEGLSCCSRLSVTAENNPEVVALYPQLDHAQLMPWVTGTTWFDVHQGHKSVWALTPWECLQLTTSLACIGATLEAQGLAHCDLKPSHLIVDTAPLRMSVQLVGLEEIWSRHLYKTVRQRERAQNEYIHPSAPEAGPHSDRFAGALLMAEMLAWHSEKVASEVRNQVDSLFTRDELEARLSPKLTDLKSALVRHSEDIWKLFFQAWDSKSLQDCPRLEDWHNALRRVGREKIEYAWMRPSVRRRSPVVVGVAP